MKRAFILILLASLCTQYEVFQHFIYVLYRNGFYCYHYDIVGREGCFTIQDDWGEVFVERSVAEGPFIKTVQNQEWKEIKSSLDGGFGRRVLRCRVGDFDYVMKEYRQKFGWWALFTPVKGIRVWNNHRIAGDLLSTPKPILAFRRLKEGVIISGVVFPYEGESVKQSYIDHYNEEALKIVKEMRQARFLHGDIASENLLVNQMQKMQVIDLDGGCFFQKDATLFWNEHKRDAEALERLYASSCK